MFFMSQLSFFIFLHDLCSCLLLILFSLLMRTFLLTYCSLIKPIDSLIVTKILIANQSTGLETGFFRNTFAIFCCFLLLSDVFLTKCYLTLAVWLTAVFRLDPGIWPSTFFRPFLLLFYSIIFVRFWCFLPTAIVCVWRSLWWPIIHPSADLTLL